MLNSRSSKKNAYLFAALEVTCDLNTDIETNEATCYVVRVMRLVNGLGI